MVPVKQKLSREVPNSAGLPRLAVEHDTNKTHGIFLGPQQTHVELGGT